MIEDSLIVKYYKCSKSKSAYLSTFGISPYFKEQLEKRIKEEFVLCFDESMHKLYQKRQMGVRA